MAEATKAAAPTKPSPEEKQAAAEAEVDALVKKGLKALDEFEKLDQKRSTASSPRRRSPR